ncbi:MAG: hypothetical protein QOE70_1663 [Chthoniobacter sp.]|nr:hypothetical protein [Chthoniobacter sp.]
MIRTLITHVKTTHSVSAARLFVVAAMLLSWFVITNHCALGLMRRTVQTKEEHAHCHGGGAIPGKESPPGEVRECCKSMHAALPGKAEVKFDTAKVQLQLFALVEALAADIAKPAASVFIFDHGPPRSLTFAESVLQRSLLSHAPPFAV